MDRAWAQLDSEEIGLVRELLADLQGIKSLAKDKSAAERLPELLQDASLQPAGVTVWREFLETLRKCEGLVPAWGVFAYKARAWEALGDEESSLLFLRKSLASDPGNARLEYTLLGQFWRIRSDEAVERANRIAEDASSHPLLLFKAAEILFGDNEQREAGKSSEYRRCIALFEKVSQRGTEVHDPPPRSVFSGAHVLAGLCWERLQNKVNAEAEYSEALRLDPNSVVALVARGKLSYGEDNAAAREDFQRAVELKARLVWPYFFLAHASLRNSKFQECIAYCTEGLKRTNDPDIAANLWHWLGISRYMANGNKSELEGSLNRAKALSPANRDIDRNQKLLSEIEQSEEIEFWQIPPEEEIEEIAQAHFDLELA